MARFIVNENFQFGGALRRTDAELVIDDEMAIAEKKKGINDETGKAISGLINHCTPADEHTEDILSGKIKPRKDPIASEKDRLKDEKDKEIARLRGVFKKIGKAYDPKWAIDKLGKELKKAIKEVGEAKTDPKKEVKV